MSDIIKYNFLTLLLLVQLVSNAQYDGNLILSKQELHQDLQLFKSILFEVHPNPFRFLNQYEFEMIFNEYKDLIDKPTSSHEFFKMVSALMSKVGEGHSSVVPSETAKKQLREEKKLLPFDVHFYGDKAYISKDFVADQVELEGYELISINSVPIKDIMYQIDSISWLGT